MKKFVLTGAVIGMTAFVTPAFASVATVNTTSDVQIESNTSATANFGGVNAPGGNAASSVHTTTVVNGDSGSVDIKIKTERDGTANVETIHRDIEAGQGVFIDAATSSAGAKTSAQVRIGAQTGSSSASSTQMHAEDAVAARVQALLQVADRDGGIGEEVRAVAQDMASTSDEVDQAMTKVENRPGWLTFLFGTDYGNLGTLRSGIVKTQNQIQRLTMARDRATSSSTQAALDVQINALQDSASSTQAFVEDNANTFSLFGWVARLFR